MMSAVSREGSFGYLAFAQTREISSWAHAASVGGPQIAAFGYRPRLVRVLDTHSRELSLLRPEGSRWAVVDGRCRMLAADASPLPGLFAMGLAVGPGASWEHGGELGFQGQINSLWLWQHRLGLILFEEVMMRVRQDLEMKFNSLGSSSLAAAGSSSAVNADAHLNGRGV